ncbi:MAG: hypothetical protein F9K47_11300 [Burkholderiales bacterium]|nr:MAG: hypothetical protein F9K47_11300 [Burkholderiales bacterium]
MADNGDKKTSTTTMLIWAVVVVLFALPMVYVAAARSITKVATVVWQVEALPALLLPTGRHWWVDLGEVRNRGLRLTGEGLMLMNAQAGRYGGMLLLPLMAYWGWRLAHSPVKGLRRRLSARELMRCQAEYWPAARPVLNLDLLGKDKDHPHFRRALTPQEFAILERIATNVRIAVRDEKSGEDTVLDHVPPEMIGRRVMHLLKCDFDEGRAKEVFAAQLGQAWQGIDKCAPALQGVLAAFLAHAHRENKERMIELKRELADGWGRPGPIAQAMLAKYGRCSLLATAAQDHSFTYTVLRRVYGQAKGLSGKLPSSEFLWLKAVDRIAFYCLNEEGRRGAWAMTAGIRAHYQAERVAAETNKSLPPAQQIRLDAPYVVGAVKAMRVELDRIGALDGTGRLVRAKERI